MAVASQNIMLTKKNKFFFFEGRNRLFKKKKLKKKREIIDTRDVEFFLLGLLERPVMVEKTKRHKATNDKEQTLT